MGSESISPAIRYEVAAEHVALITIDRQFAGNAINADVALGLERAVRIVEEDRAIRVAILTGAGDRHFCSGADLRDVTAGKIATFFTKDGGFAGLARALRRKPWVAAVNGVALAGGLEIALACDLLICCETASFGLPEVKVGLVAGGGGAVRLGQRLPPHVATDMVLTGAPIIAERAFALGLASRLVPQGRLLEEAVSLARQIAGNSPAAVRESLRILHTARDGSEAEGWSASEAAMEAITRSGDSIEGPMAFLAKRSPSWDVERR